MPFRTIETRDTSHLQWKQDFQADALIVAYHFPDHDRNEPPHDHNFMEIQLCAGGRGMQQIPTGDIAFSRGSALLIRPGGWHRHHDNEAMDAYVCCFDPQIIKHQLRWTLQEPSLNRLLWRAPSERDFGVSVLSLEENALTQCLTYFDALVALGENDDPAERPVRIGYLTLILSFLARGILPGDMEAAAREPVHSAVTRCLSMMEESLDQPWTSEDLAKKLNINASYLGRLFKSALGTSPMAFLTQMRLERAAQLLNRTDKRISDVGMEVGWPDANYFARRFRAYFGVSASEYRERQIRHQQEVNEHPEARFQAMSTFSTPDRNKGARSQGR